RDQSPAFSMRHRGSPINFRYFERGFSMARSRGSGEAEASINKWADRLLPLVRIGIIGCPFPSAARCGHGSPIEERKKKREKLIVTHSGQLFSLGRFPQRTPHST